MKCSIITAAFECSSTSSFQLEYAAEEYLLHSNAAALPAAFLMLE
jgi:hypothetical protein